MDTQDLWEIYRRWVAGQTISHMAAAEQRDRKTVIEYIAAMEALGLTAGDEPISREDFVQRTAGVFPQKSERGRPMRERLEPHLEELQQLIGRSEDPLVAKNAFLVVRRKYDLQVSYETFKRFARDNRLGEQPVHSSAGTGTRPLRTPISNVFFRSCCSGRRRVCRPTRGRT